MTDVIVLTILSNIFILVSVIIGYNLSQGLFFGSRFAKPKKGLKAGERRKAAKKSAKPKKPLKPSAVAKYRTIGEMEADTPEARAELKL